MRFKNNILKEDRNFNAEILIFVIKKFTYIRMYITWKSINALLRYTAIRKPVPLATQYNQ